MDDTNKIERSEICRLTLQAIEGTLSDSKFFLLEEYLKSNPSLCDAYVETIILYSMMRKMETSYDTNEKEDACPFDTTTWQAMAEYEELAPPVEVIKEKAAPSALPIFVPQPRKINKWSVVTAITSAAALFFMLLLVHYVPERQSHVVGQLKRTVNAEWASVSGDIDEGDELYAGPMKLVKGIAEITFVSGVQIIIEGPSVFEIESPNRICLNSGSLVANIENSMEKRFVVCTGNASIVDYGTEFGVSFDASGNTQTHVFQGCVELRQGSDPLKFDKALRLEIGQGAIADKQGALYKTNIMPEKFVRKEQLDDRILAAKGSAYHRWKVYNQRLDCDPSLVAHYTFEKNKDQPEGLFNVSAYPGDIPNGKLGGDSFNSPQWVTGRWPQITALEFDRTKDQAVQIPEHPALNISGEITLAVWVKPNISDDLYWGGILLSCRNKSDVNGVNYTLAFRNTQGPTPLNKQKIRFIRRPLGENAGGHYESDYVTLEKNHWHLVSVTHNNKEIRFFFDGVFVSSKECVYNFAPSPAELIIGNSLVGEGVSEKHHGLIGEVAIFNRALSDSEIQEMYRAGKM